MAHLRYTADTHAWGGCVRFKDGWERFALDRHVLISMAVKGDERSIMAAFTGKEQKLLREKSCVFLL